MKRWIACIICLSILICTFGACSKETTPPELPKKTTDSEEDGIKLSRYTIVYPERASTVVRDAALLLAETIEPLIDDEVKIMMDDETVDAVDEKKEILIGLTTRAASKAYYEGTPSFCYHVFKKDHKIVLAGYTDTLTAEAVTYFIETYVNKADDGVIAPIADYEGKIADMLTLSSGNSSAFRVVYSKEDRLNVPYMEETLNTVVTKVKNKTDLELPLFYASSAYSALQDEIVVGCLSYPELAEAYTDLKLGGYMITVLNHKILLAATNEAGYKNALYAFERMLAANTLYGTTDISLPIGYKTSELSLSVLENLPSPSVTPKSLLPAGNGAQLAIFEDVTKNFFTTYIEQLKAAGFTEYTATSFDGDGETQKNYFGTYVSDVNTVDIGFHESFGRMYLSISPREGLTLPKASAPEYTPVDSTKYPTILTQVGTYEFHPTEHAMCYIVRLADGSFIVYDTSYGSFGGRKVAEEIYEILKKQAPDPNNIVISAIFLTHPHGDHMGGFVQFADLYASSTKITVKQIVYNYPATSLCKTSTESNYISQVQNAMKKFGVKTEIVKPRAGNVLYYADVKFNVLYTQENYLGAQDHFDDGNTMSMVTQMVTAGGCKVLFGADQPVKDVIWGGYSFCEGAIHRWYGSFLESYVVTMFHHGLGGGADYIIYPTVKPKIVLWPGTWLRINGQSNGEPYMNNGSPYKLYEYGYNQYFSTGLTPDVWHETPNANGVHGWFVADDGIQILTFFGSEAVVATYETRDLYLGRG